MSILCQGNSVRKFSDHALRRDGSTYRVAVVGAGIAGLAAAHSLQEQGLDVRVLERGRGVGGRSAHRCRDSHCFDHGAPYFTACDNRFIRRLESWLDLGVVARWDGRIVSFGSSKTPTSVTQTMRYVGVPGMNAMAKDLARELDVNVDCAVAEVVRDKGLWSLKTGSGDRLGPFDALILAMPPEQASRLALPAEPTVAIGKRELLPCWCAMVAFDMPLAVDFDGAFISDESPVAASLDWIARDSSKPGRGAGERWVIHASASWSAQRLAEPPDVVARELLDHFFGALAVAPVEPTYLAGHRWSFARSCGQGVLDCLWDAEHALALCGDWCRAGGIEDAYLSGVAAANRVIGASIGQG